MTPIEQAIEALENVHNLMQSVDTCSRNNFSNLAAESVIEVQAALSALRGVDQQPDPTPEQWIASTVPPATARDRWFYEQDRLAERDPRTTPPPAPVLLTEAERLSEAELRDMVTEWFDSDESEIRRAEHLARDIESEVLRRIGGGV